MPTDNAWLRRRIADTRADLVELERRGKACEEGREKRALRKHWRYKKSLLVRLESAYENSIKLPHEIPDSDSAPELEGYPYF